MNFLCSNYLGLVSYSEGLRLQDEIVARVLASENEIGEVLGLEHSAVITLGKRGRIEDDLQATEAEIKNRGIELHVSARGGQATLHSPGQLVIYPCVSLTKLGLGVRDYVGLLERVTIGLLKGLGISAAPGPHEPGLYTENGKIAFFGIRVSHGIASHGIAINAENDLTLFKLIRSCGKDNEKFDRIKFKKGQDLPKIFALWVVHFHDELRKAGCNFQ